MLLNIASAILGIGVIIIIVEVLKRLGLVHGELARKSIHITSGIFLAALPLWMTRREIVIVAVIMLVFILVSRSLHLVTAIEDVRRWTIGEELFGVSIAMAALLFDNGAVYAAAILHLALADGFAGLLGAKFGKKRHYHWFWADKSLLGSTVFFAVSLLLWTGFVATQGVTVDYIQLYVIASALVLTLVEGALGAGLDNFAVPLIAGYIAQSIV